MSPVRTIVFVLLSSMIMMAAIMMQNAANAPVDPAAAENGGQVVADADSADAPDNSATENADSESADAAPTDGSEPQSDDGSSNEAADPDSEETSTEQANTDPATSSTTNAGDQANDVEAKETADEAGPTTAQTDAAAWHGELSFLGSLNDDGKDRFLITTNSKGGTIRRIELNARKKNGDYKYRTLEFHKGYLGNLDCYDTVKGCVIQGVGPGTPASRATTASGDVGLMPGDIIVALNGEPITGAAEFEMMIIDREKWSDPGEVVTMKIERGESRTPMEFSITLTEKPLEVIQREPPFLDKNVEDSVVQRSQAFVHPESFVMSLKKPTGENWPDLDGAMRTGAWEASTKDNSDGGATVEFKYEVPADLIAKAEMAGPITAYKRYTLVPVADENMADPDSRSYHWLFEFEIVNGASEPQQIGYELMGPSGTTPETWWYQNKIHGRQTAVGYIAGSRDVVASSKADSFRFFGGPEIIKDAKKDNPKINKLVDQFDGDPNERLLNYISVDTLYFNVSMIPITSEGENYEVYGAIAFPTGPPKDQLPKNVRAQKLVNNTFFIYAKPKIEAGQSYKQAFEVFSGPKEPRVLEKYELEDARAFGWFAWFSKPLCWLLHKLFYLTGSFSYGIPIIILTLFVRSLMIPISRKAAMNAQMMQYLQPQIKEIADKYKDDMQKRSQAQQALFKKYNYSPFGGCFMMFFQLPIFIGLYRGLSVDIALRDQPLIPGLKWCSNLAAPDQLLYWKEWVPFGLGDETGWLGPFLNILPLFTIVLFLAQQKLFMPPAVDDQQKMMQKVMTFMMIFMGVMFFKVPSGLCLYFITSSLWGIIERKLLPKPKLDTENLPKFDVESAGKVAPPPPKEAGPLTNRKALDEKKRLAKERQRKLRGRDN